MSVNSMANMVVNRRRAESNNTPKPSGLRELAQISGVEDIEKPNGEASSLATAMKLLTTYVPVEVVSLYISILAFISGRSDSEAIGTPLFWIFLVSTPIVLWIVTATKLKNSGLPLPLSPVKWPWWEMLAATIAFAVWGFSLPGSPFSTLGSWGLIAGIAVIVTPVVLGLVAPLLQQKSS